LKSDQNGIESLNPLPRELILEELKSDQNGIERAIRAWSEYLKGNPLKSDQNGIERYFCKSDLLLRYFVLVEIRPKWD